MVSVNPFAEFRVGCETALKNALNRLYPQFSLVSTILESPPNPKFGELASSVCFELAKQTGKGPRKIAKQLIQIIDASKLPLVQSVKAAGEGYINFHARFERFSRLTIESVRTLGNKYGYIRTSESKRVIVEHTSVNPIHPIHIGQARNPVLGDALARILKAHGHTVSRHYYVDDVGRQSAVIAYGYEKLGKPKPEGKPDGFIGAIYAVTSCLMEIQRLKKEIAKRKELSPNQEVSKLQRELDDWTSVAVDLKDGSPKLFAQLLDEIGGDEDPENQVGDFIRRYEAGEKNAKRLIREVCQLCLQGFRETLAKAGISLDSWDWESDFIWNGDVMRVLDDLKSTPYVYREAGVLEFDAEKVARDLDLKEALGLKKDYELSPLTLVRADDTTLYTTRDIPYHLWKFQKADKVVNVIGREQTLPQLQLKMAL
ncbi:MAG: arginine--tRNA ligase, partial [Candidatus Bathyarchaeota archaeon]